MVKILLSQHIRKINSTKCLACLLFRTRNLIACENESQIYVYLKKKLIK